MRYFSPRGFPNTHLHICRSYDHLDWPTIERIHKLKGDAVTYVVPLGLKSWFESCGIPSDQIVQLDWDQTWEARHPGVSFICAPAQHGSGACTKYLSCLIFVFNNWFIGRGMLDQRTTLWASWIVQQDLGGEKKATVYHAG